MAETRLAPELDFGGLTPDEAFATLGNEIRLDILRVLWETGAAHEYDDVSDTAGTLSFSALRRRVEIEDNGQFNYHLSQLVPAFVRRTDDGYRLSGAGQQIARSVIAVSGTAAVDASSIDRACPLCEAPLAVSYEEQWLRISCTGCEGLFGDETPDGSVFLSTYPAAGLATRPPEDALETGFYRCMLDIAYLMRDVCRECGGAITASMTHCESHRTTATAPCQSCGNRFPVWVEQRCDGCRFAKRLPAEAFVLGLTPVISFLYDLGIDILAPAFDDVIELLQHRSETTVASDPLRVTVTIRGEGERLVVALDEDMQVVDVDRRRAD